MSEVYYLQTASESAKKNYIDNRLPDTLNQCLSSDYSTQNTG